METDINVLLYFLCAIQIISNLWLTCNLKYQWRNRTRRLEELHNISAWFAQLLVRSPYACYRAPRPTLPCFPLRSSECWDASLVTDCPPDWKPTNFNSFLKVTKLSSQITHFNRNYKKDRQCTYNVILRRVRVANVAVEKQYVLHILRVCL
jgi:hypothetical protein